MRNINGVTKIYGYKVPYISRRDTTQDIGYDKAEGAIKNLKITSSVYIHNYNPGEERMVFENDNDYSDLTFIKHVKRLPKVTLVYYWSTGILKNDRLRKLWRKDKHKIINIIKYFTEKLY